MKLLVANTKSGYAGVYCSHRKFVARVTRDGKSIYLGIFATAREAALCVARSPEGQRGKLGRGANLSDQRCSTAQENLYWESTSSGAVAESSDAALELALGRQQLVLDVGFVGFMPKGLNPEGSFSKHADCRRVSACVWHDHEIFSKSTQELIDDLTKVPLSGGGSGGDLHHYTCHVYGYIIPTHKHVAFEHTQQEAEQEAIAARLKQAPCELLAKAVGITTQKGAFGRWKPIERAEAVMGPQQHDAGSFLAAFCGCDAEMQVRRIEELVHREICDHFAGQPKLVGFCTSSEIPHNELWECTPGLPAKDVLSYSKDRHRHWLQQAPGPFKFWDRGETVAAFDVIKKTTPIQWEHGVDKHWFPACVRSACQVGEAAAIGYTA